MKKMFFLAAGFAALLMTACGGEKTEEKKEEKKEVSAETKEKFEAMIDEVTVVDAIITKIDGALTSYDAEKQTAYLDSMKTVAGKAKKDIQAQALPLIDSLVALNAQVADWKNILNGEKEAWGTITEDFSAVFTSIEKGEADEEKLLPRVDEFTEQFKNKTETLNSIANEWAKIDTYSAALNALFAPATK
jgi:chromosome segregation ATPase